MRYLNTKQSLVRLLEFDRVLAFHTIVRCHEECLHSFTSELFYLLLKVILNILQLNVTKVLSFFISLVEVGVLGLNSE